MATPFDITWPQGPKPQRHSQEECGMGRRMEQPPMKTTSNRLLERRSLENVGIIPRAFARRGASQRAAQSPLRTL